MGYNEIKQHGTLDLPIQLYHVDKNHPKFEMASHWHQSLEIIRILKGSLEIKLDKRKHIAKTGDVVFVNSEVIHSAVPSENCVYECIVMHLEMLFTKDEASKFFIEGILNSDYVIEEFIPSSNTILEKEIHNLFYAMNNMSSGYKFKVIGSLYQLFGSIIDNHLYKSSHYDEKSIKDKSIPKLKKVLYFIRSNYDKPITLEDMAEFTEMSPKYFCSFFKKMTLKTPMEYLKAYRIERAARMLLNTDESVTDIAYSSGFNDLSYFIKTFKDVKGVTPQKFRNT